MVKLLGALERSLEVFPPSELRSEIGEFHGLVRDHVLTPFNLFDYFPYLPRITGLIAKTSRVLAAPDRCALDQAIRKALSPLAAATASWRINGIASPPDKRARQPHRELRKTILQAVTATRASRRSVTVQERTAGG